MLNISGLNEGVVLDHIEAGKSLDIYYNLGLDKIEKPVAIIKNAKSKKMGKKDIIKIEGDVLDLIDFDVIGYIDHNITINIINISTTTIPLNITSGVITYTTLPIISLLFVPASLVLFASPLVIYLLSLISISL